MSESGTPEAILSVEKVAEFRERYGNGPAGQSMEITTRQWWVESVAASHEALRALHVVRHDVEATSGGPPASESGTPEATHFLCAYHGEVLPVDEYQQHCDDKHRGNFIAVGFVAPESGTSEAIPSSEPGGAAVTEILDAEEVSALHHHTFDEWFTWKASDRNVVARVCASHEALRRALSEAERERDENAEAGLDLAGQCAQLERRADETIEALRGLMDGIDKGVGWSDFQELRGRARALLVSLEAKEEG